MRRTPASGLRRRSWMLVGVAIAMAAPSANEVRDVHVHGAGRAVLLAGHAVPAFVELHERLVFHEVDGEHVQRADVHADGAALVGDALVLVDDDGGLGAGDGDGHVLFSSGQAAWAGRATRRRW